MNWHLLSRLQKKRQGWNKVLFPRAYLDRAGVIPTQSPLDQTFVHPSCLQPWMAIRGPHPQLAAQSCGRQGLFDSGNFAKLHQEVSFHLPRAAALRVTKD